MKTLHLLSTAAAALLITAGTASAQNDSVGAAPAPPAIQNAPAEKIAPPMNAGERKAPETTGAGPDLKFGERETTGQGSKPLELGSGGNTKLKGSAGADTRAGDPGAKVGANAGAKADTDVKAQTRTGESAGDKSSSSSSQAAGEDKAGSAQESSQSGSGQAQATTGQGAAGAAKLSTEQRSQITSAFKQQDVKALDSSEVNFSISIGATVPRHLHFYPVPQPVVRIYPAWEGYRFILVGGQILIIEPDEYVIVAVLAV